MVNPFPGRVKRLWEHWNIRGALLLSLFLQLLLILFAPARKRTGNGAVILLMWMAYLLADAVATYAIGLIVNSQGNPPDPTKENGDLLAFWAPFLLVHLGGQDTITAFSLEDNQLWIRHLLTFGVQLTLTGYVFFQTLPSNKVVLPTCLLFVAGFIKYLERTFSLYLASKETFRKSLLRKPHAGVDYARLMNEYGARIPDLPRSLTRRRSMMKSNVSDVLSKKVLQDDIDLVLRAYGCFSLLRGLIVDLLIRETQYKCIQNLWHGRKGESSDFRMIEVELNFFYEVLYTKTVVVHLYLGMLCRSISFVSVIAASIVFRFHVKKHGYFNAFDVSVTYTLLCGALALDTFALLKALLSDWTLTGALRINLNETYCSRFMSLFCDGIVRLYSKLVLNRPRMDADKRELHVLSVPFFSRRWSGYVSGYNLIGYCLKRRPLRKPRAKYCSCIQLVRDAIRTTISVTKVDKLVIQCCRIVGTVVKRAVGFLPVHKAIKWMDLEDFMNELQYKSKEPLTLELWKFIMEELTKKAEANKAEKNNAEKLAEANNAEKNNAEKLADARGEWVLENDFASEDCTEIMSFIVDVAFDESLLMWHIATELLYRDKKVYPGGDGYTDKYISKIVSDYMLYLLVMRPNMMEAVSSSDQILRFKDTCVDAKRFFESIGVGPTEVKTACKKTLGLNMEIAPKEVKGGEDSMSVYFEANMLAKELMRLKEKKWKVMSKVWIEMLTYAASHCSSSAHAQQISKGGELITFVWLAMAHYGLTGKQFQKKR